jgi:hypothetical protein
MDIVLVFKKKSPQSQSRFRAGSMHLAHGKEAWAQVVGQEERVQVYFNRYLPEDTSWFDRWMFSVEELRKTKKPFVDNFFPRLLTHSFAEPSV